MKVFIVIITILSASCCFAQPYTNDNYVQNFYTTCKTEKYSAFQQASVGTELLETNQYNRAINKYNNAIEKDSSYCDAYYMLGYIYQRQGNYEQSIKYCDKSIELNQRNPSGWSIKGTTYLMINDTLNALACFENAKKYGPGLIDGYYGITLTLFLQKKYEDAMSVIIEFEKVQNKSTAKRDIKKLEKLKSNLSSIK